MLPDGDRVDRSTLPACLCEENSNRLVSLLELVNTFGTFEFGRIISEIQSLSTALYALAKAARRADTAAPASDFLPEILEAIRQAEGFAKVIGFRNSERIASMAKAKLGPDADASAAAAELDHVKYELLSDAGSCMFVQVSPLNRAYIDSVALFGQDVAQAFPSAIADIRAAGNCLAVGLGTAAVFHLMRSVEWALRSLCAHLGFSRLRSRKKNGRLTYTPLPWGDWESILTGAKSRVTEKATALKRGPRKQLYQEFYYPALQDIEGIKDAWRNHVMHTRREYTAAEALAIKDRVERLMRHLAGRLNEC